MRENLCPNPIETRHDYGARVPFVIKQVRKEFPDIARRIEMPGHTLGAAADREGEAIESPA